MMSRRPSTMAVGLACALLLIALEPIAARLRFDNRTRRLRGIAGPRGREGHL